MTPRPFGPRGLGAVLAVLVAIGIVARTLGAFAAIIQGYLSVHYDWRVELGMVTGQVAFQWMFLARRTWDERWSYALILIAVSSLGAVLLWPLLALAAHVTPLEATAWFFAVVAVMFAVHWWLVDRHALPKWLCATWVLYRFLLLIALVRWPAVHEHALIFSANGARPPSGSSMAPSRAGATP